MTTELMKVDNAVDLVLQLDKMERFQKLRDEILTCLRRMREAQSTLRDTKIELRELLSTDVAEDQELSNLLKSMTDVTSEESKD